MANTSRRLFWKDILVHLYDPLSVTARHSGRSLCSSEDMTTLENNNKCFSFSGFNKILYCQHTCSDAFFLISTQFYQQMENMATFIDHKSYNYCWLNSYCQATQHNNIRCTHVQALCKAIIMSFVCYIMFNKLSLSFSLHGTEHLFSQHRRHSVKWPCKFLRLCDLDAYADDFFSSGKKKKKKGYNKTLDDIINKHKSKKYLDDIVTGHQSRNSIWSRVKHQRIKDRTKKMQRQGPDWRGKCNTRFTPPGVAEYGN